MDTKESHTRKQVSPSSRRAWIEITGLWGVENKLSVALLAEGVDRNKFDAATYPGATVALLAEGVDRNF